MMGWFLTYHHGIVTYIYRCVETKSYLLSQHTVFLYVVEVHNRQRVNHWGYFGFQDLKVGFQDRYSGTIL